MQQARKIAGQMEIFKFALYISFPLGTLYYFNTPELMDEIPTSADAIYNRAKAWEKTLFTDLPRTKQELQETRSSMRSYYLSKKESS